MKPKMTLVPLAVSLALAACGGGAPKKLPPPEAPVRVAKVERQAVPLEVAAVGHVEASSIVSVKPQVGGVVLKVGFREGEDVAVGQILFQIDPRPFQAALAQAKANLERDRARLAEAERTLVRYEELIKKEYVTQEQLDGARANSAALKATVVGDEAAVEQSRLNLAYCQIESPVAGRTGSLLVYAGNVVKAGDDKPLVILNQIEPVRVSFAVPERVLADVKARSREGRLKVTVTPPGGAPHEGELTFVDNAVDSTTGTITLKATFANRDRALWPGQFAQVALNLATDAAVAVVPTDAVQTGQMGTYVFVVKEDKTVDLRPITVVRSWKSVSVIAKGLEPGETVVTDGQIRLAPGTRISIKEDAAVAGPASEGAKP
jgi:multidrug efflux system membrane fusion protein